MSQNPEQAGKAITGGEFLIRKTAAKDIFIPEEWNEEQQMIKKMTHDFIAQRVQPQHRSHRPAGARLDEKLMEEAGELGLLGQLRPPKNLAAWAWTSRPRC